jgi:hypothetical protein
MLEPAAVAAVVESMPETIASTVDLVLSDPSGASGSDAPPPESATLEAPRAQQGQCAPQEPVALTGS